MPAKHRARKPVTWSSELIAVAVAEKVGVVETAADFFKKRAGEATGEGLMKFLATRPRPRSNRKICSGSGGPPAQAELGRGTLRVSDDCDGISRPPRHPGMIWLFGVLKCWITELTVLETGFDDCTFDF
jgi:hypothetical protein